MFTIKYNKTTSHIDGLAIRATGGGKDMGDHVSDYSQNACGSLTRYRFAAGPSFETVAEVLDYAETSSRNLCKTCLKAAAAMLECQAAELSANAPEDAPESAPVTPASAETNTEQGGEMRFSRVTSATGSTQYRAEGESFRYTAERDGKEWTLSIRRLETVAGVRVAKVGHPFKEANHDTLTTCNAVAMEFEALGDSYRPAEHGHAERYTTAVLRAYGTSTYEFSELVDAGTPESANVLPVSTTNEDHSGETPMAEKTATKNDVNADQGKAVIEQIDANIERVRSLAEAENLEGIEELSAETETLISSLSGAGSIKVKKEKRAAYKAAATVQEKPKKEVAKKAAEGVVVAKTWDQYEGTVELVGMGAEKVAEGITAHVKVSNLAKEIAAISYDVWLRIPNKAGVPDLVGDSDAAKKGARAIYDKALPLFEDNYDNAQALKKLIRSAQDFRSDVRAEWLRSLDGDTEEAAERRAIVAKVLEGKPEGEKASEWVANVYGTSTIGQAEAKRLAYHEKKKAAELAAGSSSAEGAGEGEGDEGEGAGEGAADTSTPDERATKLTEKLVKDIKTGKPEDFEKASEETKEAIRAKLEEAMKGLKAMIAATL
ncbi:hypothetical protein ACFW81_02560 [Streptomyces angustmyceticus]|uniref:hypothetical protein n=1 Tax=Streptomyces angustmyceticus TaxID=285578 RepID=UPI003678B7A0